MSDINDLHFDDKNFNKHTEFGMSLLEKSLNQFGAGRSVLVDKDNNIIAGNGIVEAAQNAGITKTRVIETDGTELVVVKRKDVELNSRQGREMAFADNATSSVDLDWDEDNLKTEFSEEEVKGWGVDLDWDEDKEIEEDEVPEANESEPADSELGKIYQLGNHRLMCGDSTDAGSVAILMDGQKADMVFTDPPYGVSASGGRSQTKEKLGMKAIANDELRKDELTQFLVDFISVMEYKDNASIYICYAWATQKEFTEAILNSNLKIKNCIIWDKKVFGLNGFKGYRPQYEMIYFCCKEDFEWYGNKAESNIWQIDREINREEQGNHPTPKPIGLIAKALNNSSRPKDIVLDVFGGSGSTLIACEQLGRKCYMMELDPKYCDVIRKRYWKFVTGSEEGWQDGTKAI